MDLIALKSWFKVCFILSMCTKHQRCHSPPPLKKSHPEIRGDTGPGLILGQYQGRHRVDSTSIGKIFISLILTGLQKLP